MDAAGFKQEFLPLHPRLYRLAYALTENRRDAEDIIQEAYCKLWRQRKELSHIRNTEAFCVRLVKNLCLDFLHATRHERDRTSLDNLSQADKCASPETQTMERDEITLLQQWIEQLPLNQRQVLRLHGIEGCSPKEIQQLTGLSAVNIRVLISRARKTLREQYNKLKEYERERF
ncbi:MAG: RNA polymerase sigma factor [Tannerellaceae bacterium]|nr:RNA polymerase sigma factor [Tannerellaceae bacterium]